MPVCAACCEMPFYSVLTTLGGNLDIMGEETERLVVMSRLPKIQAPPRVRARFSPGFGACAPSHQAAQPGPWLHAGLWDYNLGVPQPPGWSLLDLAR